MNLTLVALFAARSGAPSFALAPSGRNVKFEIVRSCVSEYSRSVVFGSVANRLVSFHASRFLKGLQPALMTSSFNVNDQTFYQRGTVDLCFSVIEISDCLFAMSVATPGIRGGALCVGLNCGERPVARITGTSFVSCMADECGAVFMRCRETTVNRTCFSFCNASISDHSFQFFGDGENPHVLSEITVSNCRRSKGDNVMSLCGQKLMKFEFRVDKLNSTLNRAKSGAGAMGITYIPQAHISQSLFFNATSFYLFVFESIDSCTMDQVSFLTPRTNGAGFHYYGRTSSDCFLMTLKSCYFYRCHFHNGNADERSIGESNFTVILIDCISFHSGNCSNLNWVDKGAHTDECQVATSGTDPIGTISIPFPNDCLFYTPPTMAPPKNYTALIAILVTVAMTASVGVGLIALCVWKQRSRNELHQWMQDNLDTNSFHKQSACFVNSSQK